MDSFLAAPTKIIDQILPLIAFSWKLLSIFKRKKGANKFLRNYEEENNMKKIQDHHKYFTCELEVQYLLFPDKNISYFVTNF